MIKKIMAGTTVLLMLFSMTIPVGAVTFSDTNKDIEILFEEYAGYRFEDVDVTEIATVKFYIKCPELETIEVAMVDLVYNSGTTDWVSTEHDLNDGLIVEIDVYGQIEAGDFFEAALGTWDEEVEGTFSVEVLDGNGDVLGKGVFEQGPTSPGDEESQTSIESQPEASHPPSESTTPPTTSAPPSTVSTVSPASTGSVNVITAAIMTGLSAFAIVSMKKRKDE